MGAEQSNTTRPTASRARKRSSGVLGLYQNKKTRTWILDVIYDGERLRKRYPPDLPEKTIKLIAAKDRQAFITSILLTGAPPPEAPTITDLTVAAALTRFEKEAFQDFRPRTRKLYQRLLIPLKAHLGDVRLSALSVLDLERYKRTRTAARPGRRGTGMVTCNRELQVLSACGERVRSWGLVDAAWLNPVAKVKRFKESKGRERIVTYAEEAALLGALREPYRTLTQLGLESGLRVQSEGIPITWEDVDLDKARLTIVATHAKNGRPRHLPLSADMVTRLRAMQATSRSRYVFAARGGGQLHRFKTVYFEAVRRLGLAGTGLNIHALRHTWASRMVESGADLTLLMALGGWSSLVMVQRYSHHRPERAVEGIARMLAARPGALAPPQESPRRITRVPRNA